jgi:hypothetical protein
MGGQLSCSQTAHDQNVLGRCAQEKLIRPSLHEVKRKK